MPVQCPNKCNTESLLRKDLPEHSELYPLEKVKCPFHIIGCEVVAPRFDLLDHNYMDEDQTVHMLNMPKHFQQVCHEMMDQRMHNLEKKFDSMKKLEAEIEGMKSNFQTHQAECTSYSNAGDLLKGDTLSSFGKLLSELASSNKTTKPSIMELQLSVHVCKLIAERTFSPCYHQNGQL